MIHDKDGAKDKTRLTTCGTCLESFPAATAQASANLCRAHIEAGCPKARPDRLNADGMQRDDYEDLMW